MSIVVPPELEPVGPAQAAPPRRPDSVRRTTTIDSTWPDGMGTDTVIQGRARDLLTPAGGPARTLAEASMDVLVGTDRRIRAMTTQPPRPELAGLIDGPSGRGYRALLAEAVPGEVAAATPLHLLLDDLPGAILVSAFAFSRWYSLEKYLDSGARERARNLVGICTGFQEGSSGLAPDGSSRWTQRTKVVDPIDSGDDDLGWHALLEIQEVSMRRARRIDVWIDEDTIHVDAFFQDSSTLPEGGRQAVHEYTLTAEADLPSRTVRAITPVPRVLPYRECPLAVVNAAGLIGLRLADLRSAVLRRLRGTAGCTHLNDTLRALADVPALTNLLTGATDDR
jgi:hypothetical protein